MIRRQRRLHLVLWCLLLPALLATILLAMRSDRERSFPAALERSRAR